MDATTFMDKKIVDYINANYYAVKFNAEQKEAIVFNGKTYKFVDNGGKGYHELANYLLQGRFSYPTTVYLDEKLALLTPVPGYLEPLQLDPILHYFGTGAYLNMDYAAFQKTYTK
jgi:thioredoxin-related protein